MDRGSPGRGSIEGCFTSVDHQQREISPSGSVLFTPICKLLMYSHPPYQTKHVHSLPLSTPTSRRTRAGRPASHQDPPLCREIATPETHSRLRSPDTSRRLAATQQPSHQSTAPTQTNTATASARPPSSVTSPPARTRRARTRARISTVCDRTICLPSTHVCAPLTDVYLW